MRSLIRLLLTMVVTAAVIAATVVLVSPHVRAVASANESELEDIDLDKLDAFAVRSYMFAGDGSLITTLHERENRSPVPLVLVPPTVRDSILAVEDADFYVHAGVNLRANVRALVENVQSGGIAQGGSTVTQQLVKNALLNPEQSFARKSQEAALALRLEERLSEVAAQQGAPDPRRAAKNLILEKYLNTVYFGSGAYGVQAAAQTYWGRPVEELGWGEGAMLAAIIANPVAHDPTLHPGKARQQRQIALDRIAELGHVSTDEARRLGEQPLPPKRCYATKAALDPGNAHCGDAPLVENETYFGNKVFKELTTKAEFGLGATEAEREKAIYEGGLRIFTTLDPRAQALAKSAVLDTIPPDAQEKGITGALFSFDHRTGAVRAMHGGPDVLADEYDLTTDGDGRQTGSTFKLFTLLAALEAGNSMYDIVQGAGPDLVKPKDGPNGEDWTVDGPGGSLVDVTKKSSNAAFVRLAWKVLGLDTVASMAERLGASVPAVHKGEAMTLGTADQTPMTMASAYGAVANGGEQVTPHFVDRIEDRHGKVIYEHKAAPKRVIEPAIACVATAILAENVKSGTGTRAQLSLQPAAGKTGTTDKAADVWFVGYTPHLTTAVWMGHPKLLLPNEHMNGGPNQGGRYPASIFKAFNEPYHAGLEVKGFDTCPPPDHPPQMVRGSNQPFAPGPPLPATPGAQGGVVVVPPPPPPVAPPAPGPSISVPPQMPTRPPATLPTTRPPAPKPPPTTAPPPPTTAPPIIIIPPIGGDGP